MREVGAAILALALCAAPALAQHSGAPSGVPKKECLSDADRELIGKLKALNRPTTEKDPPPPFNPDYFVGDVDDGVRRPRVAAGA